MQRLLVLAVLSGGLMAACTGGETPTGSSPSAAAEWTKIGETETYIYYPKNGSSRVRSMQVLRSTRPEGPPLRA